MPVSILLPEAAHPKHTRDQRPHQEDPMTTTTELIPSEELEARELRRAARGLTRTWWYDPTAWITGLRLLRRARAIEREASR